MKPKYIKYFFSIIVVILIGLAIYFIYQQEKQTPENTVVEEKVEEAPILTDLRLGIVGYDTMNPILSKNRNVQELSRLVFEPLLTFDENYKLQPCLATEWSKTGDTSYVLKLRQDVKWQDGSNFTAADVKFTIDRLKEIPSIYAYNVQHVVAVDIIEDYLIKITVDGSIAFFEYNLTFPILCQQFYLEQDFQTTAKNNLPMGTGIFKVSSNEGGKITLKKNQNWWNRQEKEPKLETINVTLYNSMGEVYNAFKTGNVDLFSTNSTNLEQYIGTIGFHKKEYKGRQQDFLAINSNHPLLSRKEVRQAFNYTIDKNSIVANVFAGQYYTYDFPLEILSWVYSSQTNSAGYNPEQAKQVLLEAGWEYKNNTWQKVENYKTLRLNFNLIVQNNNATRVAVAESIKSNLDAIGIKLNLIKVSDNQYSNYLENKNYELLLTGNNLPLAPDVSTYFGANNLLNYQNEEASIILNDMPNIFDETLLKEKVKKLADIYKNEVPCISLYTNKNTVIYSQNLMGDITPNCYNIFYHIENWYRQY